MKVHLKPLHEQIVVITGATSGIGLVTAREAARKGARLSLASRNEQALENLTTELREHGCDTIFTVTDVSKEADVRRLANATIQYFGGFDTWVNNAAVSIYGTVEEATLEDQKHLFDINYWGSVYGSRIACEHLREHGGKLINVGSVLSERAIPIQGTYSAAKAALMGFTDALRMELEADNAPVSVTLIKPGTIDTPYHDRAANYLDVAPKNPPPIYAPETVARAILHAAEHHEREVVVGSGGKAITTLGTLAPRLSDKIMSKLMPRLQRTNRPAPGTQTNTLYDTTDELQERGGYPLTREHSFYSTAMRHKAVTATALAGTAFAAYMLSTSHEARDLIRRKH